MLALTAPGIRAVAACLLAVAVAQSAPIDLAPFGTVRRAPTGASALERSSPVHRWPVTIDSTNALQVEWTHPRDVRTVVVEIAGDAPRAGDITVEWWRRIWPDNGTGGWMKLDDPLNGQWTHAKTTATPGGSGASAHRYDLGPLDAREAPGIKHTGFPFRRTYKVRVLAAQPVAVKKLAVFSDAVERRARLRFEWNVDTRVPGRWAPEFEARNGRILKTAAAGRSAALVEVAYADSTNRLSADRGMVICRSGEVRSFSVFVDDVLREGGLFVRDIGAFVSDADRGWNHATWPGPQGDVWTRGTIAEQVARLPEQNLAQVSNAIPKKTPNDLFLGAPNLRQEIGLGPKGDVRLCADSLRSPGPDAERRPWKWQELTAQFRSGPQPEFWGKDPRAITRTLDEGWLPVVHHEWAESDITVVQSCVAAPLSQGIRTLQSTNGCEPVVLVTRFELRNNDAAPRTAQLWMQFNHQPPWRVDPDGLLALAAPSDGTARAGLTPVRGRFNTCGKGRLELLALDLAGTNKGPREAVRYQVELAPRETHTVELTLPYIELLDERELVALRSTTFAATRDSVVKFWKARIAAGMTYEVPEPILNDFFKANLWHVLITTDIDPATGFHQHGAATHHYKNYLNETMMVARSLEMRGEHEAARRLIEPFLACQSRKGLPGNFKSKDGVLWAAHPGEPDPYTAQGYNMHHGFGLWAAAEHFTWTRDAAWLRGIADRLVSGCDWVTRERQATKFKHPDSSRPVEYGLPPAGDLEDVEEYLYWYATSAYYHLGMQQAAEALAQVGDRRAKRLGRDTEAFRKDIQASLAESVATSPVVRLRDGTWVPFVPPRAYALTHLKEGWIREGLYPALHLLDGEVYRADHPFAGWMLQDLEDNIFLSKESGYGVEDARGNFFNCGGFTLQPNLLNLPLLYLQRDEVPNFLRGFYNTFWASVYPDAMCFAEWVPAYGEGGGPLFKTPDECKFIQWMRDMVVLEREDSLELGLGVPRAWMADGRRLKVERAATFFGSLDLEIVSCAATGQIHATAKLRRTAALKSIALRLRHPGGRPIQSARVNGRPARVNARRQLIELPVGTPAWEVIAQF